MHATPRPSAAPGRRGRPRARTPAARAAAAKFSRRARSRARKPSPPSARGLHRVDQVVGDVDAVERVVEPGAGDRVAEHDLDVARAAASRGRVAGEGAHGHAPPPAGGGSSAAPTIAARAGHEDGHEGTMPDVRAIRSPRGVRTQPCAVAVGAAASSGWPPRASCCAAARTRASSCSSARPVGRPPDRRKLRRRPRRHLLRARLAEGAAVRRGRARAVRVLRRARASPYERCGKVIVAARPRPSSPRLDELERRGRANGVPGLRAHRRRPSCARSSRTPPASTALHSPHTGIVDFAARRARARRRARGRRRRPSRPAARSTASTRRTGRTLRRARPRRAPARAGRSSAPARGRTGSRSPAGADPDPRIVPFRGGYLQPARRTRAELVRGADLPGPRPRPPVPRRAPDPAHRRRGPARAHGADGRRRATPTACARVRAATCAPRWPGPAPGG